MILVLSSSGDLTADYVVRALEGRREKVIRVNTNDLLADWRIGWSPSAQRYTSDHSSFSPGEARAVYYRRAYAPSPLPRTDDAAWAFVARESRVLVRALYEDLRCPWISHHAAITAAENKPRQLSLARRLGFRVPDSVATNDAVLAKSFFERHDRIVTKALSYGDLGGGKVLHTSIVPAWSAEIADEFALCPVLLQQFVEKRTEYRTTVVDDTVFTCRIDSQAHDEYAIDMRRGLADRNMRHELAALPYEVDRMCVELVRAMGLRFGAIDIVEDLRGDLWFLEINPNGQWAWIEDRTNAPIAETIAKGLLGNL